MPEQTDLLAHTPPRRLKAIGIATVLLAGGVVAFGLISRVHADAKLSQSAAASSIPIVKVISPSVGGSQVLVLPGQVQAFYDAPIHARVSGYLKRWYVDIGAPVKAGQLLAEIDTPDLDQQLNQAKADLQTALANQKLAASTAQRWNGLLGQDAVSKQDADEKNGDAAAKAAVVASARANVQRLEALESFKRITAPFAGVVTARNTDIGALISVGGASDTPLFNVADESRLRVYVQTPQSYSAQVRPGMSASFTVPEHPGQAFQAKVAALANAVNTQSGAELVQLLVDNTAGALKPGDYAQVHFDLAPAAPGSGGLQIPSSALIFRGANMAAAVLGPNGRVQIKPVSIGEDMGSTVQIAAGLGPADRVIDNPPDSLRDGDQVHVAAAGGARAVR